jgi:hypothetical protein
MLLRLPAPPKDWYHGADPWLRETDPEWGFAEDDPQAIEACGRDLSAVLKRETLPRLESALADGALARDLLENRERSQFGIWQPVWWLCALWLLEDDAPIEQLEELVEVGQADGMSERVRSWIA